MILCSRLLDLVFAPFRIGGVTKMRRIAVIVLTLVFAVTASRDGDNPEPDLEPDFGDVPLDD